MSGEHEIEKLMETAMESIRSMLDVNTIVGDIIESASGVSVIPVSKVSCGFIAGGGEYGRTSVDGRPFAGGSGAGISLQPVAFLTVSQDQVRLIPVWGATPLDKAIEAVPLIGESLRHLWQTPQDKNRRGETPEQ
ncbi:MAG: GerW family sporulation protein [Firmicutes bacterium]|nr:GerW family sporulation protein [Bacillota bacterium]